MIDGSKRRGKTHYAVAMAVRLADELGMKSLIVCTDREAVARRVRAEGAEARVVERGVEVTRKEKTQ